MKHGVIIRRCRRNLGIDCVIFLKVIQFTELLELVWIGEMLKEYGGEEGFRAFIQKQQEDLRRELTEKFGDDTAAKIAYLQGKNAEK